MPTRTAAAERPPAVAGTFYPSPAAELAATVDGLLARAAAPPDVDGLMALVVPHAGYVYSGPVAASSYALLRDRPVARVAILGPAHFVPIAGSAVPGADGWRTPLGTVPIDAELRAAALRSGATLDDAVHEREHAVEVQLPFLQRAVGPSVGALPVAVGVADPTVVADLIAALVPLALVVVSTDLSHYLDDATARRVDRRTADAVLAKEPDRIGREDACGSFALRGLVELARRDGLCLRLLDLRTSADTAGDPRQVVGYGAFAVARPSDG